MKDISVFFKDKNIKNEIRKVKISDRFKDKDGNVVEFEIQPLNPVLYTKLKDNNTKITIAKDGNGYPKMDTVAITKELLSKCVIYPNLNDTELQNSYGVMGALDLATELLTTVEFNTLVEFLWKIHGESKELTIEEVKK